MKLEPECVGCLFNQIMRALNLLNPDLSTEEILKAQKKLINYLSNINIYKEETPRIAKFVYDIVSETLNDPDPYKNLKKQYNELALEYYSKVEKIVKKSEDPILQAIIVAAIANTIDFGSQHEIDFIYDLKHFKMEKLVINDYDKFKEALKKTKHLLVVGDNTGEIVYDKLLISTINQKYTEIEIVYTVRSAPIINDVTLDDAKFVKMVDLVKVIESCPTPGIDIESSTEEFKRYFYLKDNIIISKGQGNFESLYGLDFPELEIYYLLKAKCNLMERLLDVNIGDFIFKKKTIGF